jgi:hypothetical protein
MPCPPRTNGATMRHATLRRIHARLTARLLNPCDQCHARAGEPCHPECPYVRTYSYPARRDTP